MTNPPRIRQMRTFYISYALLSILLLFGVGPISAKNVDDLTLEQFFHIVAKRVGWFVGGHPPFHLLLTYKPYINSFFINLCLFTSKYFSRRREEQANCPEDNCWPRMLLINSDRVIGSTPSSSLWLPSCIQIGSMMCLLSERLTLPCGPIWGGWSKILHTASQSYIGLWIHLLL